MPYHRTVEPLDPWWWHADKLPETVGVGDVALQRKTRRQKYEDDTDKINTSVSEEHGR